MLKFKDSKYGLHGIIQAVDGKEEELVSILLDAAELVSASQGCHLYIVSSDAVDSNKIVITEVWESKEDHDNSLKIEGVKELISRAMPLIEEQPEKGMELNVFGGAGL